MKYIDANVFIYPVVNPESDIKAISSKKILDKIINREIFAVTSVLTWDEFVYTLRKYLGKEIAASEGEKFLRFPNLKFVSADEKIILKAQYFVFKYNLDPRDAIHLATAITLNINEILSDDSDFDNLDEIKRVKI